MRVNSRRTKSTTWVTFSHKRLDETKRREEDTSQIKGFPKQDLSDIGFVVRERFLKF